jgi:SAM-dependent methyltransferase
MSGVRDEMDQIARFFDAEYLDYVDDLPVLESYAHRTGGPLLELGCGTGRALIRLAQAGYQVTGVDCSPAMLRLAWSKAESAGMSRHVRLVEGDFMDADLGGVYPFAFTLMNSFLHLPDLESQIVALKHWRDALAPKGLLLIDILNPDMGQLAAMDGRLEWERTWTLGDTGERVMKFLTRVVEPAAQVMSVNHIYEEVAADGTLRRTVAALNLRYIWRFEAELLLDKAGFNLEAIHGDWGMGPFTGDSDRMILIAKKRRS